MKSRSIRAALATVVAATALASGTATAQAATAWAAAPSAVVAPRSAVADGPADALSAITASAADAARDRVLRLAKSNLPAEIRTSAWNALRSTRGDAAIEEWLTPGGGYDAAKQRLRDTRSRNRAYCEQVVRTHTVSFSPEVRAAAERALKGSEADRAAFVRTGYAEAQKRDRAAREADGRHRQEIAAKDREFVRAMAVNDPGEHVRAAAGWAVRPGSTDADVAEFFGYGWASGAALDLEAYRLRVADAEVRRHHLLTRLIAQAAEAERELLTAADAARARAEAERTWRAVAEHAESARTAWLAEQSAARAQAESWRTVARLSRESADSVWKNITAPAEARQGDWAAEQAEAGEAASFWKDMADRAREGETRVKS
ncbi:ALF repeat-containing protein [Streptomyces sp. P11-1]|uniref:ALF repeat-containing protein n=1 Tax=Streptomyces sp. P11-1 TaxID=3423221 RepID=UPI003D2EAD41